MLIAAELEESHDEITNKNKELKKQKDDIQDLADYLYEANSTISQMHEELQDRKEQIEAKNNELVELNNEKNNLIGIVAHDLKSPLNQIRGLTNIIKMSAGGMNDESLGYVNLIEDSSMRLSNLINKILDVEAIESKKVNLSLEQIDYVKTVKDVVKMFVELAQKKDITIQTKFECKRKLISVDKSYILQIIENLLSNAIKFSPHKKNIYLSVFNDQNQVVCQIKDEGPGLTKEDQKKLFGKYQKLSAKPTGDEISTGLGLSIVKKFVDAMDGKIWCESKYRKGTSFFVAFPAS